MYKPIFLIFKKLVKFIFPFFEKIAGLSGRRTSEFSKIYKIFIFLYKHLRPNGVVLAEVLGHKMWLNPCDTGIAPALLLFGAWEKFIVEIFKREIKKGMTVLDIGANIGYYTLIAANLVGRNGRVFAFEPEPNNFFYLKENIKANSYENVVCCIQKGVSNKTGETKLFLDDETITYHRIYDIGNGRKSVTINTITLDDFFKNSNAKIDFIKVDVEGAEAAVFQGMTNILKENKKIKIITEFYPLRLIDYGYDPETFLNELMKYSFKLYNINEPKQKIEPIYVNCIKEICNIKNCTNLLCVKE